MSKVVVIHTQLAAAEVKEKNERFATDPDKVFLHLAKQPHGFNTRDLSAFVAKYVADPTQRAQVYAKAENAWFDTIVRDLWASRGTVRHGSGARHLLTEDIVREFSPGLAQLEAAARQL